MYSFRLGLEAGAWQEKGDPKVALWRLTRLADNPIWRGTAHHRASFFS